MLATDSPPNLSDAQRSAGQDLLTQIVRFLARWHKQQPEDVRNLFQDWTDDLSTTTLTVPELRSLRRVVRNLANSCSDRSGMYSDNLPLQAMPGTILGSAGLVGSQVAHLPPLLLFSLIVLGFAAAVVGVVLGVKQRRWKIPVDAMRAFEAELSKMIERNASATISHASSMQHIRELDDFVLGRDDSIETTAPMNVSPLAPVGVDTQPSPPKIRIDTELGAPRSLRIDLEGDSAEDGKAEEETSEDAPSVTSEHATTKAKK